MLRIPEIFLGTCKRMSLAVSDTEAVEVLYDRFLYLRVKGKGEGGGVQWVEMVLLYDKSGLIG